MKILNKNYDANEMFLGVFLFVLIIMSMNKSIPGDVEEILTSFQGMFVSLILLLVFFLKFNSVIGILLVIFLYIIFQNSGNSNSVVPSNVKVMPKETKPIVNKKKVNNYQSLEEETVQNMLPISKQNNISQPKYSSVSSSSELYTTI
tara:strand:- start:180 stop:620 length:441 start_codon:yes stop_codon:yes gene_type:complete